MMLLQHNVNHKGYAKGSESHPQTFNMWQVMKAVKEPGRKYGYDQLK